MPKVSASPFTKRMYAKELKKHYIITLVYVFFHFILNLYYFGIYNVSDSLQV